MRGIQFNQQGSEQEKRWLQPTNQSLGRRIYVISGFYLTVFQAIKRLCQRFTTIFTTSVGRRLEIWRDTKADNEAREQDFPTVFHHKHTPIHLKFRCTLETESEQTTSISVHVR